MIVDLAALKKANAERWDRAHLSRDFTAVARRLVAPEAKARYVAVSKKTGVPWPFIAVVHERESGQNWGRSLAQGDPWNEISTHVPRGRGPFSSWEEAAVDALINCPPFAARNTDWSIGGRLTKLEEYNGLGYAARGLPSPYIWAGTDIYRAGKFVRDGVFDPNAIDQQPGCAGMLFTMEKLDSSIDLGAVPAPKPAPAPAPVPAPAPRSIWQTIAAFFTAIFRRK